MSDWPPIVLQELEPDCPEPPPLRRSYPLGEALKAALSDDFTDEHSEAWALIDAAVELIAEHYLFDRDLVFQTVCELEDEIEAEEGVANFGRLLERPWGFTVLGIRVAQKLLGDEGDGVPSLLLSYH